VKSQKSLKQSAIHHLKVDPVPIFGFSTMDGDLSSTDPSQVDMFDEATEIDMDTGEIKPVNETRSNIKSIK